MANNPFAGVRSFVIYGNGVTIIVTDVGQQAHRTSDLIAHPNRTAGFTRAVTSAQTDGEEPHRDVWDRVVRDPNVMPRLGYNGEEYDSVGRKIN